MLPYACRGIAYVMEHARYMNIVGIATVVLISYLLSHKRSAINWGQIARSFALLFVVAFGVLCTKTGVQLLHAISQSVQLLYCSAHKGIAFMFGNLAHCDHVWGFVFAFHVLPVIIFFGAFMNILFYFGIAQALVGGLNRIVSPILKTSGAETLCAIANSFLGQTDAPLLIRHYLEKMTKSEFFVVMVSGMATISGAILVAFVAMGVPAEHMLACSVMSIPASILIAKIIYPETEQSVHDDAATIALDADVAGTNFFDAIARGTMDGVQLAVGVGAMLISFVALLFFADEMLQRLLWVVQHGARIVGFTYAIPFFSIEDIFAYFFAPFGYFLGFSGSEALMAGRLIGTKVVLNEAIAYSKMVALPLSERSMDILTYALCGFSNISCIGIQIGGIGALVPSKRTWLTELGVYAVIAGTLSNLLCAMVASLLL